jgi:RsiW-degrading membrane proteinase PrsW (M82 family)
MTLTKLFKTRIYSWLALLFILLVPVCNLGAVRLGFRADFHDEAELLLFLLYAAPLWVGFAVVLCFEMYRRTVMGKPPDHNLIQMMILGGIVSSALGLLLCPVGPDLWSVSTGVLILSNALICAILGKIIQYLLRLSQNSTR